MIKFRLRAKLVLVQGQTCLSAHQAPTKVLKLMLSIVILCQRYLSKIHVVNNEKKESTAAGKIFDDQNRQI